MSVPIIQTKLQIPRIPQKIVQRPDLVEELDRGLQAGAEITLVSAPAGFGKTTFVAAWLDQLDLPVAWLTLDSGDDDPGRFFRYLIAALQVIQPEAAESLSKLVRSGQLPGAEVLSAALINCILGIPTRFFLVLDDFHTVQDDLILHVLRELSNYHPDPLHLVLITREDPPLPLARLRANHQLAEIRAKDLRFSKENIQYYFREVLSISLEDEEVISLEETTEGWIAGLQLAGLSIRDAKGPARWITNLRGSNHFIFSYLAEQVLDQQEHEVQEFLLMTAFLEKFNVDLCQAILPGYPADKIIPYLVNANLFITPLDDQMMWFRYHHLFADLLRGLMRKREAGQIKTIHRKASRWYAEADMAREAVRHALNGEDFQTALTLIEEHALETVLAGNAKTVNSWIEGLPGEWRIKHTKTYLAFAWMHLLQGSYSELQHDLNALEQVFRKDWTTMDERDSFRAEWLVIQALLAIGSGDPEGGGVLVNQAAALAPQGDQRVLSIVQFGQASAHRLSDNLASAAVSYRNSIASGRKSGNLIAEMLSTTGLADLEFEQGELETAYKILEPVIQRLENSLSAPPISNVIYGLLGEICFQWCKLENAGQYFQQGYRLSVFGGLQSGIISYRVQLSRLALLRGRLEAAVLEVEKAQQSISEEVPEYVRQELLSQKVRIFLSRDRTDRAEALLINQGFSFHPEFSYPAIKPGDRISYSSGMLYQSSLEVMLRRSRETGDQEHFQSGIELADQVLEDASQTLPILTKIGMLLKRAKLRAGSGDLAGSQDDFRQAVIAGAKGNLLGIFLEEGSEGVGEVIKLLKDDPVADGTGQFLIRLQEAAMQLRQQASIPTAGLSPAAPGIADLAEPLTERELEVLNTLEDGLTYQEIGSRLFISLNTVRYHVKAIYGKLNVNNRTLAIEKARQLKII